MLMRICQTVVQTSMSSRTFITFDHVIFLNPVIGIISFCYYTFVTFLSCIKKVTLVLFSLMQSLPIHERVNICNCPFLCKCPHLSITPKRGTFYHLIVWKTTSFSVLFISALCLFRFCLFCSWQALLVLVVAKLFIFV